MRRIKAVLVRPFQALLNNVHVNHNLSAAIQRQVSEECAAFILQNARSALHFDHREQLWDYTLPLLRDGLILEFGVRGGYSINYFADRLPDRTLYGFDSFEGLHVDWSGTDAPKGTFDRGGVMPQVRSNVQLVKGWFDQTLPTFMNAHPGPVALLHIDCDTYEATKIALDHLSGKLVGGSVVIFDDYLGYRGWSVGEHKAWTEYAQANALRYRYIGFTNERIALVVQ